MAEQEVLKDLKKLSPKDRIKKLKEMQEKSKKEIEEAQKMIHVSEEEDILEETFKNVPVPEIKHITIEDLFGKEEPNKEKLHKAKQSEDSRKEKEEEIQRQKDYSPNNLEGSVGASSSKNSDKNSDDSHSGMYDSSHRQRSIAELKNDLYSVQNRMGNEDNMNEDDRHELYKIGKELYIKEKEMDAGHYMADQRARDDVQKLREKQKDLYRN